MERIYTNPNALNREISAAESVSNLSGRDDLNISESIQHQWIDAEFDSCLENARIKLEHFRDLWRAAVDDWNDLLSGKRIDTSKK